MKRSLEEDPIEEKTKKKMKLEEIEEEDGEASEMRSGFSHLDEDLLFEVMKHMDARTLGAAACVSRLWCKTAMDERLWEMICARQSAIIARGSRQLRSVVLALGGFRRLHALYLWPLQKLPSHAASASVPSSSAFPRGLISPHWGKDEVHLSLSLLSIRCFEMMNLNNRGR